MLKAKRLSLDNGLEVVLINDNKKNTSSAYLSVNVGGFVKDFKMNGKDYHLKYGIAHFLEHYLLENSIYGNVMQSFGNDYIDSNGFTSPYRTVFYISTVHDFEDNLVKLLNVVNNPLFDKEKIEGVKPPILREIERCIDNPYRKVNEFCFKQIFKEVPFDVTLGNKEDIKNLSIEDIKLFHDAFYNAKNEMLVISGKFNEEKIIKLVKDTYKKFNNNCDSKIYEYKEIDKVVSKESSTKDKDDFIRISHKINIKNIKPLDRDKLSYYLSFLKYANLSERSDLFKYILDNDISKFAITNFGDFGIDKNYLLINTILYTDKFEEGRKLLFDKLNNLEYDEQLFEQWKNKQIIAKVNSLEEFSNAVKDYMDNVYLYGLYQFDDIDFVRKLNIEECKKLMSKLDTTNYSVIICRKGEENE